MEFRLLGALEVQDGDRRVALGAGRQRAVLALLLMHANEVVTSDRLVDELWAGYPPGSARKALQVYVFRTRRALGAERIRTRSSGYVLEVGPDELDVHRFERLVREAEALRAGGEDALGAAALHEALGLWHGPALADFTYEQFAQAEIARLEELRLVALEERIDADLRAGHGADLVGELEALVAKHPYRERLRGQTMLALYRAGRQAEALAAYQETRALLVEELGIEPSPALQRLEGAILRQEPELEPPAPVAPPPGPSEPAREARKTVTVAAFGLVQAGGTLDPEAGRRLRQSLATPVSRACARHGGQMAGKTGASLVAVFGIPTVHEDDALRALRAAAELRELELPVHAGIETGEVVVGGEEGGEDLLSTQVAESAVRLRDTAAENEIVLGEATRRLLGASARVEATASGWRLLELVRGPRPVIDGPEAPLVGREEELAQLGGILARAIRERMPHLVTVLGSAGIGKSRLAREFTALIGDEAAVLTGRCLSYGEGITFWPLREIVHDAAGEVTGESVLALLAGAEDAPLVAAGLAAALELAEKSGASEEEIFWAVRRLLETLAEERPLVVVLEDVHWAEATFLDLVEHLAEWVREAPLLLLCLARPELLEARPRWGGGTPNAASLWLEPLDAEESQRLIEELPGGAQLPEATRERLLATCAGNPLFLEQLLALVREGVRLGDEPPIPPTIAALLAARLDRLGPAERAVLEAAAIVGKEFAPDALIELLPEEGRASAARHLEALVRRQFVRPVRALDRREAFRFGHVLIQQAAYRAIPKEVRARLHERFAAWLTATAGARAGELDEIVGYHLEQAYRYRAELSPIDQALRALGDRASDLLAQAGQHALLRADYAAAVNLLDRARSLQSDHPRRLSLSVSLAEALQFAGKLEQARSLLNEVIEEAGERGDQRNEWLARVDYTSISAFVEPREWTTDRLKETAERAIRVFVALSDDRGLTRAWGLAVNVSSGQGHYDEAARQSARALAHARRTGDEHDELIWLDVLLMLMYFGSAHVGEVRRQAERFLARVGESSRPGFRALLTLAGVSAMEGAADESRRLFYRAKSIGEEMRLDWAPARTAVIAQDVGPLLGDAEFAERELRAGYEFLEAIGERGIRSTMAAHLADALYRLDRKADAEHFADLSLELTSTDDIASQVRGRAVKAKLLAAKGDYEAAYHLAREAVRLSDDTDDLFQHGQVLMALAEVLRLGGRDADAIPVLRQAVEVSERKGNVVTAQEARARLAGLHAGASAPRAGR
jgi:DNA-binding SARP family transcriptional activator/class 3 adenylate cyclase/tetratricopeptide (TPR) repeat protein